MKLYVSRLRYVKENTKVFLEGINYRVNQESKTNYDKFLPQYNSILVNREDFVQKYGEGHYQFPLVVEFKLEKGKGAILV